MATPAGTDRRSMPSQGQELLPPASCHRSGWSHRVREVGPRRGNLALALDGEVINADALQFYRGMDIGTAKVTRGGAQGSPSPLAGHHGGHPGGQRVRTSRAEAERHRRNPFTGKTRHPGRRIRSVRPGRTGRPGVPRHRSGHPAAGSKRRLTRRAWPPLRTRLEEVDPFRRPVWETPGA